MMDIQLVREPLKRMLRRLVQCRSPASGRERTYLSVANALDYYAAGDFPSITWLDWSDHTNVKLLKINLDLDAGFCYLKPIVGSTLGAGG